MIKTMRLDISVVLPGVSADDACVGRLAELMAQNPGVASVHVLRPGEPPPFDAIHGTARDRRPAMPQRASGALCLHYDPGQLTMADVADMSLRASAGLAKRYGHVTLPMPAAKACDERAAADSALYALPGVTGIVPDYAAHLVRVEFDTGATTAEYIRERAGAPERRASVAARLARRVGVFFRRRR